MVRCHFYWQVQKGRTFQIMKASNHDEVTKFSGLCLHPQLSPLDVHRSWCRFGISYNPPLVKRVSTGDFVNVQEAFDRDVRHAKSSLIHPRFQFVACTISQPKEQKRNMEMPMNVIVTCEGKQCGLSVRVVINPVTNEMTHFVVRDLIRRHIERLVPIKFVTSSNHEEITLNCTHEQWRNLQPFEESDFIKVEVPHVRSYGYGWPYVETMYETVDAPVTSQNIPPYSRDVRRGAKVMATDGSIGHIEEFVYDAKTFRITHIVLAKGHLWNEQDIVIPVECIDDFTEDHIRLTIDKAAVAKLPVVPIHRQVTVV